MYICNDCGNRFEAPATYIEAYTDGQAFPWERYECGGKRVCRVLPGVRSEDIDELERCHICGEYAEELNINGCCEACEGALRRKLSELLHANFTRGEIEVLNDSLDGEALM